MTKLPRPFVAHPDVVASMMTTLLRRGIPANELQDAVAEVQLRALEARTLATATVDVRGWRRVCAKIAAEYAIDESRKRASRATYHAGLSGEADGTAADQESPHEVAERQPLLGALQELVLTGELPDHALAILHAEAADAPPRVVARELGLTGRAVARKLQTIRRVLREHVEQRGLVETRPAPPLDPGP
jgi:DNA-directed RNA polymerase specialized sigma24 family protein